ncbi:MAG: hypothetical protein GJ676_02130 [Rhodobacteraceae bacterium]|nr:hypothetical protein [Paracoccaceae bacterium]
MGLLGLAALAWWYFGTSRKLPADTVAAAYATPLTAPSATLSVYHLGHSLVGRDMPAMLEQLAGSGHSHHSQLGWGTSLREHWEPDVAINGFDAENAHSRFKPARDALATGSYDAVVLTEMVEIKDAIKYHDSSKYLKIWADFVRQANPEARIYLYESWHNLDDPEGWLVRLDRDLDTYWIGKVLADDLKAHPENPVRVIPGGQVMARLARTLLDSGGVAGLKQIEDLFAKHPDGTQDTIHLNDQGAYLIALTHYAVLYHLDPKGLPHTLLRADGTPAQAPTQEAAELMQKTVWEVVTSMPCTGVAQ